MHISEFQDLISKKYEKRDRQRGIPATFMWFVEEVGELATALAEKNTTKEEKQEEKKDEGSGLKGKLGRFAKKAISKDSKKDSDEPAFSYYTELVEFTPVEVSDAEFTVPSNYKEKD